MARRILLVIARAIAWGIVAWGLLLCSGLVQAAEPEAVALELLRVLGYSGPAPTITWVNASDVVEICGCNLKDGGSWAIYRDNTAYLSLAVDLDDPWGRSLLLHELEHHVQAVRQGPVRDCADWRDREVRAYEIQNAWLQAQGSGRRALFTGVCQ